MKYSLLFIFLFIKLYGLAQVSDTLEVRTSHIIKTNDYLSAKLSLVNDIETFEVRTNYSSYDLRPNVKNLLKLSLNYRFISFSFSYAPPFIPGNNDNDLKGESRVHSYNLNFSFTHLQQSFSYTNVKGYYLYNTYDFIPNWNKNNDAYLQIPHLVYNGFRASTGYKFNKKFSIKALTTQTERQLKRAGSFIPFLTFNYYIVDDRTTLTQSSHSQKSNNFKTVLSPGYYYTWVFKEKFYLSGGTGIGVGVIYSQLHTRSISDQITTDQTNIIYRADLALALGYNSKRLFFGLQGSASYEQYSQGNTSSFIVDNTSNYQLFIGYRFQAPEKINNVVDMMDDKKNYYMNKYLIKK